MRGGAGACLWRCPPACGDARAAHQSTLLLPCDKNHCKPSSLRACRLTQRWEASLWLNGRQLYLGGFNSQAGHSKRTASAQQAHSKRSQRSRADAAASLPPSQPASLPHCPLALHHCPPPPLRPAGGRGARVRPGGAGLQGPGRHHQLQPRRLHRAAARDTGLHPGAVRSVACALCQSAVKGAGSGCD